MRSLSEGERRVVSHLIAAAGFAAEVAALRATPMDDGGMGSLRFSSATDSPRFGAVLGEAWFMDADSVPVSAALYVDQNGSLFELDVWKVNFSPLRRWPEAHHIRDGLPTPTAP
jgi:hypothetical protein